LAKPLTPHQRLALEWLEEGGELWVSRADDQKAIALRLRGATYHLPVAVFDALFRQDLLKPVRADRTATRYELTALGWEQARLARGEEYA
jgi:hypothetical protein